MSHQIAHNAKLGMCAEKHSVKFFSVLPLENVPWNVWGKKSNQDYMISKLTLTVLSNQIQVSKIYCQISILWQYRLGIPDRNHMLVNDNYHVLIHASHGILLSWIYCAIYDHVPMARSKCFTQVLSALPLTGGLSFDLPCYFTLYNKHLYWSLGNSRNS